MIENPDTTLTELTRRLVERFAPDRIVLFGSRARGDHHPESDYDVMVVLGQSLHSQDAVRDAVQDIGASVDVFVGTRERFERRRSDVGTLEYAADQEGHILYSSAPVLEPRRVRELPSEPSSEPPPSFAEWIARAHRDFTVMEVVLKHAPDVRDAAVFHAHQGVEKMLKAVLVSRHVPPPRSHELTSLCAALPNELRGDARLQEACIGLQRLWPSSRYPDEPVPTDQQVSQAVEWARRARDVVSNLIAL
jgi:HEPN domain-containing protein/predicted nucleotidyltransferase